MNFGAWARSCAVGAVVAVATAVGMSHAVAQDGSAPDATLPGPVPIKIPPSIPIHLPDFADFFSGKETFNQFIADNFPFVVSVLDKTPIDITPEFTTGCPWYKAFDYVKYNYAFPETNAAYWISTMPSTPGLDVSIRVEGAYPDTRYFSFTMYNGLGNYIDDLPDVQLTPVEPAPPNPTSEAQLPVGYHAGLHYQLIVKFTATPTVREPNTIYAGVPEPTDSRRKQRRFLMFRTYLPDVGADSTGNRGLPALYNDSSAGTVNLQNTPDQEACGEILNAAQSFYEKENKRAYYEYDLPQIHPEFKVFHGTILNTTGSGQFRNGDVSYAFAETGQTLGDMVLVRQKTMTTPGTDTVDPDVRYWSVCENTYHSTKVVACSSDRTTLTQADGSYVFVISTPENQPALAQPQYGYNWLPFGPENLGEVILRQQLPKPDFQGDYKNVTSILTPLPSTLGEWAPDITYCDQATFSANALAGGAALMAACKAASPIPYPL